MGYLYLLLTIVFETAAILFMKMSEGASQRTYIVIGGLCYAATFFLLTMALTHIAQDGIKFTSFKKVIHILGIKVAFLGVKN